MKPYPVFLIGLESRRCVVLGGGGEAERKITGLLECGAGITLIAAEVTPELTRLAELGRIHWIPRNYRCGDLRGAFLAIATEQDGATAKRLWNEAQSEGVLINVLDDTDHCNFVAGSVVRQGPLALAISTSGCAPALAVRLRQRMEATFGPEYAALLRLLATLREALAARFPDGARRKQIWYELVDSDILDHLRRGRTDLAHLRVREITGLHHPEAPADGPS